MGSYAGVKPAGVVVVAGESFMPDHVGGIIHTGADLAPDLDLLQSHHHGPDSTLTPVALCKQVPKLHSHTHMPEDCKNINYNDDDDNNTGNKHSNTSNNNNNNDADNNNNKP